MGIFLHKGTAVLREIKNSPCLPAHSIPDVYPHEVPQTSREHLEVSTYHTGVCRGQGQRQTMYPSPVVLELNSLRQAASKPAPEMRICIQAAYLEVS